MTSIDQAFKELYGNSGRDLTMEGYNERLRNLRKKDPTLAKQLARQLEPFLAEKVFLRRQKKWLQTSQGTKARVFLLPDNPHIRRDIEEIRSVMGVPNGHVKAIEHDPLWDEISKIVKPQFIRKIVEGILAAAWLNVHRRAALGESIDAENEKNLSPSLLKSAIFTTKVNFKDNNVPDWLRIPPSGPAPYNKDASPVEWAAGRLVERHRLPWHSGPHLVFYIVTQNNTFLQNIEPLDIDIKYDVKYGSNAPVDHEAFSITINGIDEFISKEDWDRVWEKMIKPRQSSIWEKRGSKPQGRRTANIHRLNNGLKMYCEMVEKQKTIAQIISDPNCGDQDQETVRKVLHDLDMLLRPAK